MVLRSFAFVLVLGFTVGLSAQMAVEYSSIKVSSDSSEDRELAAYLNPYRQGVKALTAEVVGYAAEPLSRSRPECGLANLVADSLRVVGEQEFGMEVDFALTNFGGLRRDLPEGPITMGLLMELSPFENYMVFLEVEGELVLELARSIANGSASAISGLEVIGDEDGQLVSAKLSGRDVVADEVYRMVTIDYLVANWGSLFRTEWIRKRRVSDKLVQRDAIVLHLSALTDEGVQVVDEGDGRVQLKK